MGIFYTSVTIMLVLVLLGGAVHKVMSVSRLASAAARLVGVPSELAGIPSFSAFICELIAATAILYPPARQFKTRKGGNALGSLCLIFVAGQAQRRKVRLRLPLHAG